MSVSMGLGWSVNHVQGEFALTELPKRAAETVHVARESGFHFVKCAHHWLSNILQPFPVIGYLASAGEGMGFMTSIFLLPQQNPVDIAGQAATVDVLTGGRLVLGVGLGYREAEFEAAGVPKGERAPRLGEAIGLMRELWRGKKITHRGRYYRVTDTGSPVAPLQEGGVPIFIGAQSPKAVRRAGGLGDGWIIPGFYTKADLRQHVPIFEDGAREAGKPGGGARVLMRSVVIGRTREEAVETAREWLEGQWRSEVYAQWGMQEPGTIRLDLGFEEILRERAIVGTADEVIEAVRGYVKEFGVTNFILLFRRRGMSHAEHLHQIRFYGREVLPHVV